jgi:hypothetical protein
VTAVVPGVEIFDRQKRAGVARSAGSDHPDSALSEIDATDLFIGPNVLGRTLSEQLPVM